MSVFGAIKHLSAEERQSNLNQHEIKPGNQTYMLDSDSKKLMNTHKTLTQHQFNSEFSILIKHLLDGSNETQVEIIHSLRRLLKHHVFTGNLVLPELNKKIIFQTFHQFLTQEQIGHKLNRIITEYTMLIVDLIPNVPIKSLEQENFLFLVLPYIIPNLGHEAIEVRRETLKLLHIYMRYTINLNQFINNYIEFGLKNKVKNAQKGCILSLPLLFTQEFFNLHENLTKINLEDETMNCNFFPLLQCLSDLLVHADARLFYAIYLAIQRLHTLLGNRVFKLYLQRVDQEAVLLYHKVLSRNTSTTSSHNNDDDHINNDNIENQAYLENKEHINRLIVKDNSTNETLNLEKSNQDKLNLNHEKSIRLEKIINKNDLPKFDKYDKLMLDQLVSNEEETRKQSFEILSSPTSLIQEDGMDDYLDLNEPISYEPPSFDENNIPFFKNQQIQFAENETKNVINEFRENGRNNLVKVNSTPINLNKSYKKSKKKNSKNEISIKKDTSNSNKIEIIFNDNEVIYSIFPNYIIQKALSTKLSLKNEAINQILTILKQCTCTQLTLITLNNNLHNFLNQFLIKLIEHPNFKITLQALEIIEVLVNRLKNQIITYLPSIINVVIKRLGDTRVVVRQQTIQILHLMILKLPTQPIIDTLVLHLTNRNPRVRTEVINRLTVILILIPRDQFNLCALCYDLSSLLVDKKRIVRQAVLECIAVLAQCLGPERSQKLIRCAEAIERFQDTPGLVAAVRARLARRDLPRVLPDATIKYVLNPNGFSGWYHSLADADIDWILQGSTSSTCTPPKFKIKTPINYCASYHDLTESKNLCKLKRGSCFLATHDSDKFIDQQRLNHFINYEKNDYSQFNPPDTAAKQSESTIEIERLIEKNTTDQLKSRDLSTGESNFSLQSEHELDHSDNSRELWQYYHQRYKHSYDNEFNDLETDFETSDNGEKKNEPKIQYLQASSKAISMPAINSTQLSDISERSEFTPYSQNLIEYENDLNRNLSARHHSIINSNYTKYGNEKKIDYNHEKHLQSKNDYNKKVGLKNNEKSFNKDNKRFFNKDQNDDSIQINHNKDHKNDYKQTQKIDQDENYNQDNNGKDHKNDCNQHHKIDNDIDDVKNYDKDQDKDEDKNSFNNQNVNNFDIKHKEKITNENEGEQLNGYINNVESNINENTKQNLLTNNNSLNNGKKNRKKSSEFLMQKINSEMKEDFKKTENLDCKQLNETGKEIKRKASEQINLEHKTIDAFKNQDQNNQENTLEKMLVQEINCNKEEQNKNEQFNENDYSKQNKTSGNCKRESHSTSPKKLRSQKPLIDSEVNEYNSHSSYQLLRIQPAIPSNANIRNILENVTKTEGPFKEPEEALKAAIAAFTQDAWTTKIEGMLAITRLATFHPNILKKELHTVVLALAYEIKNLRSTVSRSAIYTLGDLLFKMRGFIDTEMDIVAQALLQKCGENIQFMREDIEKALLNFVKYMPPVRASLAIINHGANHRNVLVRRISAHYLAILIENMGPTKSLLGPRDLAESLLPTAASLLLDRDAHTRYSARRIFIVLINHNQLNTLLSKHVQPAVYRAIIGSLQSIKRRGIGEKPLETIAK